MNASSRTIRLFVSSTFSDMKAERDILQAKVFPRLQQHCLANGLRFQAIDLRWGVPEEAGKDNRTMRICLRELRRCLDPGRPKPNFLILLGDRYGWLPLPEAIPADLFETLEKKIFPEEAGKLREWYWRDDNAVPPVYELQPRSKEVSEWHESVEKVLLTLLEKAEHALRSDPALTEKLREALDAVAIGVSATEQEIQAGALSVEDARHHVYAFFRNITGLPKDQLPGDYLDLEDGHPSPLAGDALENLKDRIEKKIGDNIRPYDVPWRGDGVSEEDLGGFASEVYACLKTVIDAQIGSLKKVPIEEQEEEAHRNFGEERRAGFIGRKEPLKAIADYLRDGPPQVLAVVGPAGSGKSAVIAEAVHRARLLANDDCFLLARFLGVTSASSGLIQTLQDVVGKIRKHYPLSNPDEPQPSSGGERSSSGDKKPDDREIPSDINALTNAFHEALERATPASPLWLFLDALDQLRDTQLAATLSWLPDKLPAGVRLVVASALPSPRDGDVESEPASHSPSEDPRARIERNLKRLAPGTQTIHLKPLTLEDGSLLLDQWLANVGRRLQPTQRIPILGAFAVEGNALWLRVAAEEAVRWDSRFEPESPPSTLPVLLETVLMRLSRNEEHGEILVKRSLGYLASARQGLAEDELVGILGIDPEVMKDVIARSPTEQEKKEDDRIKALPIAVWVRLHGDITFYLTERQNQGAALFGFYHRSFGEAVHGYCLDDEREVLSLHETMVRWFGGQEWYLPPPPVPGEVQRKPERSDPANARKASELPLHLRRVAELSETEDRWDMVVDVLCDLDCVETKARSGLIYELVGDYNAALTALPEFAEENNRCRIQDDVMFQHNKSLQSYAEAFFLWSRESARTKHLPKPSYPQLPRELAVTSGSFISDRGSSTRAVNLSHFSVFVSNHLARLAARPQDTVSIAFNQAEDGPVASEAGRHLADKTPPWLRHLARLTAPPVRPECLRTLEGHSARVSSIDVTSDGRRVVSASWDNTLRIWDIETGQCLRTLEGHSGRVNGVSVSPDGGRAISGSDDHTLRVWNLETGQCLRTLEGHSGWVMSVSISPDGRRVVSGGDDKDLRVWDLETGRCLRILKGHAYGVSSVIMSPDKLHAISGSSDGTLRVWDIETGRCLWKLENHRAPVTSVTVTPDGRYAISGSEDLTLRIWELETGRCLRALEGHRDWINDVSTSPDGRQAISGSYDKTLRVWDLETGRCLRTLKGHGGSDSVSMTRNGRHAISGSDDHALRVWDLAVNPHLRHPEDRSDSMVFVSVCVSPNGRRAVSRSRGLWPDRGNAPPHLWDLESGRCLATFEGHNGLVGCINVNAEGRCAITGSDDCTLRVWDLETGRCLRTLEGHRGSVTCVSLSPGRRYVVSGSSDKTLRVWDIETGRCLRILKGHTYGVMNVSISPDGRHAISGSLEEYENLLANGDHALHVWDIQSGKCLRALEGHSGQVNSVRISPDGRCMISGSNDMTLRVWDLETGCCMHTLTGHGSAVETVFMSPDGRRAVSGSHDNTLRVWDLDTGHCLHIIEGHSGLVTSIGVSPDGRYVVSGSGDKSLGVWDLETGQCLAFCPISGRAHSVVFSPSGGHILCGTIYGRMHVLVPVNFPSFGPAILTSIRRRVRCWFRLSDQHSARCQLCAKEFTPPPLIAAAIREHTAGLAPSASPCLELPDSAFNDPRLLTSCPHCGGLLKFNPFFVHSLT